VIHPLRHTTKAFVITAVLALVVAAFTATSASAASAKSKPPCWKVLINDWYDGRIDGTYPIHCYREALDHLPADVDTYSSARDDIRQALQKRITQSSQNGGNGNNSGAPPTGPGGGNSNGGNGGSNNSGNPDSGNPNTSPGTDNSNPDSPFSDAINAGKPGDADSLPIPLLVLGGVAFVLMVAGGAGFLLRRTRLRRDQLASIPSGPSGSS
jgi:hypothetical protein